jgi:hypothetical protein
MKDWLHAYSIQQTTGNPILTATGRFVVPRMALATTKELLTYMFQTSYFFAVYALAVGYKLGTLCLALCSF